MLHMVLGAQIRSGSSRSDAQLLVLQKMSYYTKTGANRELLTFDAAPIAAYRIKPQVPAQMIADARAHWKDDAKALEMFDTWQNDSKAVDEAINKLAASHAAFKTHFTSQAGRSYLEFPLFWQLFCSVVKRPLPRAAAAAAAAPPAQPVVRSNVAAAVAPIRFEPFAAFAQHQQQQQQPQQAVPPPPPLPPKQQQPQRSREEYLAMRVKVEPSS